MAFLPNPLNKYESYSYDIELALSPESIGKNSGSRLPPGSGVLIAATGKTANYYVKKLQLNNIPSTKETNINTHLTSVTLEIEEPMGFTLFDRLFIAVKSMGWKKFSEAAYYLTISFNGWLPNGSPASKVHRVTWRCTLSNLTPEINFGGTVYTMTFVPLDLIAYESDILVNQRQVRAEIKPKLEDTLKEMANAINKANGGYQGADNKPQQPDVVYEFKLGSRLKKLNLKMYVEPQVGTNTSKRATDGKLYVTMLSGETMETILIKTVLNAIDIAKHLIPGVKPDGTKEASDVPGTELGKFLLVQSQTSYTQFDNSKGKYKKKVVYTIDSHLRPESEPMPPKTLGSNSRAGALMGNGLLNKRYDYLFTGQNTEVLNLNIDFNAMFAQLLGNYNTVPTEQTVATDQEHKQKEDQDKKTRKMPTTIGNSTSMSFGGGLGRAYLEEYPVFASLQDLLSLNIQPIADQETITSGVGDMSDKFTNGMKIKLSEWWPMNKPTAPLPEMLPSMLDINIEIRGDPFWIGVADLNNNYQSCESNDSANSSNFQNGTQHFYLKFKLPETYNVSSGLPARLGRITFSGIYLVTEVNSVFENGRFSQTLRGIYQNTTLGVEL